MARTRPCIICRRWTRPDPRVGKRQRTCGSEECQRELHRRNCKHWRDRHGHLEREGRLRERIVRPVQPEGQGESRNSHESDIDWLAVRDKLGVEVAVIIEELLQHAIKSLRDEMRLQPTGFKQQFGQHIPRGPRDETDFVGPAP